jgi:PilZ domain
MSEIRSSNLLIRTKGDSITFELIDKEATCAMIGSEDLPQLLAFLNSYLCAQSNRRIGFRIDLEQLQHYISDHFRVLIATKRGRLSAMPIDLSLTGICVESEHVIAQHGDRVEVILCYDDKKVVLPSIVVRQDGPRARTAFHFIGLVKDGEPDPPSALEYIFQQLEGLWLDHRLHLEWSDRDQNKLLGNAKCTASPML